MSPQTARPGPPRQTTLKDVDVGHILRHYANLLWRYKWYIGITFPAVALLGTAVAFTVLPLKPELPVQVKLGLENPEAISAVDEYFDQAGSKAEMIQSRRFLRMVVDSLSLRLRLPDHQRSELFVSCDVDSAAAGGKYQFTTDKRGNGGYRVLFTNKDAGIEGRVVNSGSLASLSTLEAPGIRLGFTREFLVDPHDFTFYVTSTRRAVDFLLSSMRVEGADPRRGRHHIGVTLEGSDYPLLSRTANTLADMYVKENLALRRRRTSEALRTLEKQLAEAKTQLAQSEGALEGFLASNPRVGLDAGTQETITELMTLETDDRTIENTLREVQRLQSQYESNTGERKTQAVNEIVLFLSSRGNTQATVLRSELNRLLAEREELEANYARGHPEMARNRREIQDVGTQAVHALSSFASDLRERKSQRLATARSLTSRLHGLPTKQQRLAQLQRKYEIDAELHSAVLSRYNRAKVSDAAELADVFIMDYAVPPIPPGMLMIILKFIGIGFAAGAAVAFGPVILLDMLDKTARTGSDFRKMSDLVLLECIPTIRGGSSSDSGT